MECFILTAELQNGFASAFEWAPSIDGIIAYQFMIERLGPDEFSNTQSVADDQKPIEGLPIEVERHGECWWYKCSAPIFDGCHTHRTRLYRRFNAIEAEKFLEKKKSKVETTKGPYKNTMFNVCNRITHEISWHILGDKQECLRLAENITHIGAKRKSGFGAIIRWSAKDGGCESTARFKRPLPVDFAKENGIKGLEISWAIRPPAQHPGNVMHCIIPGAFDAR